MGKGGIDVYECVIDWLVKIWSIWFPDECVGVLGSKEPFNPSKFKSFDSGAMWKLKSLMTIMLAWASFAIIFIIIQRRC